MPLVGKALGNADFNNLYVALSDTITPGMPLAEAREAGSVFAYGAFIQNIVDFLIVAFCIFMMIKGMNKLNRKKEEAPAPEEPKGPTQEELLSEIRDLLKKK